MPRVRTYFRNFIQNQTTSKIQHAWNLKTKPRNATKRILYDSIQKMYGWECNGTRSIKKGHQV